MKKIFLILLCVPALAVMAACSGTSEPTDGTTGPVGSGNPEREQILLGSTSGSDVATRAVTDFPNEGYIAVLASSYDSGNLVGWSSYSDIDNQTATVDTQNGNAYTFAWPAATPKYWPLDNSPLAFRAYSPPVNGTSVSFQNALREVLLLELEEDMPDVLYASRNVNPQPYRKNDKVAVDFGEFRHALSQLTVRVVPMDGMIPTLRVSSLYVDTWQPTAYLDLTEGDNGLTLAPETANPFRYTFITSQTQFSQADPISHTVLLYPGTEVSTLVGITLVDSANTVSTVTRELGVAFFADEDNPRGGVTLQRAKNTIVTIYVRSVPLEDDDIELSGVISEWVPGGNFKVTIN